MKVRSLLAAASAFMLIGAAPAEQGRGGGAPRIEVINITTPSVHIACILGEATDVTVAVPKGLLNSGAGLFEYYWYSGTYADGSTSQRWAFAVPLGLAATVTDAGQGRVHILRSFCPYVPGAVSINWEIELVR